MTDPATQRPAPGLADDARKIVDILDDVREKMIDAELSLDVEEDNPFSLARVRLSAAIPLAESLPGKIEELERERDLAIAELRRADPNYTPLLDKYVADIQAYFERAEAAESRLAFVTAERDSAEARIKELEANPCATAANYRLNADLAFERTDKQIAQEKLAACNAEIARLREILTKIANQPESHKGRMSSYGIGWAFGHVQSIARAALAPIPEKAPPDEPTDHEAMGAMIYRGKHEARNNGGDDDQ